MKVVRLCLLLALVALLPVRGVMAAAMLCSIGGSGVQTELQVHPAGHDAAHPAMAHDHGDAPHGHDAAGSHHQAGDAHGAAEQCNLCSAYCSITSLVSAVPGLPAPPDPPSFRFPDIAAPAPSFLSGGLERPPRSV